MERGLLDFHKSLLTGEDRYLKMGSVPLEAQDLQAGRDLHRWSRDPLLATAQGHQRELGHANGTPLGLEEAGQSKTRY